MVVHAISLLAGIKALAAAGVLWQKPQMVRDAPLRSRGDILVVEPVCCGSSVVEHTIGNGEVGSSILPRSTSLFNGLDEIS
jgi:hypothetical protein